MSVVHRLIGHSGAHRPVADYRDRAAWLIRKLVRDGETQRCGNAGRTMGRAKRIIFAFSALGEAAEPPALPDGANALAAAGNDLVGITLVADIPDEHVIGCVEHIVDCYRQLD